MLRTVTFWVRYCPRQRRVLEYARYKYELGKPSRDSGHVVFQMKGYYVSRSFETQEGNPK